jgi:copper chaperone
MMTILTVSGMTCEHCEKAVTSALSTVPGVQSVHVDRASGIATVEGQDQQQPDTQAMIAAVTREGYRAEVRG